MKKIVEFLNPYLEFLKTIIEILSSIGILYLIIGFIVRFFTVSSGFLFNIFIANFQVIWLITLSLIIITIYFRLRRINSKFFTRFIDNFNHLDNWINTDKWKLDKKTLIVSHCEPGGITKMGQLWENYEITFNAKILNQCIGVIIRAQDLDNYYMLQISNDLVRPHRRVSIPKIDNKTNLIDSYSVFWQVFEEKSVSHKLLLTDWFDVKIKVIGSSVTMWINNQKVFNDSFLMIPFGRVGFRNYGDEKAIIKKFKLKII
jgi:hypothetical protein